MNQVIATEKVPIKIWTDNIEDSALSQAKNLANLPFAFHHVALMGDVHTGIGMPIGGVLATTGEVIPGSVGVDISCGVLSAKTNTRYVTKPHLKQIMGLIREKVPMGFNHHKEKQEWDGFDRAPNIKVIQQELQAAHYQLGTGGGGNHFLELQVNSEGYLYIMIHSGSRNFGFKIAKEYLGKAKKMCAKFYVTFSDPDLAFFPPDSYEAKEYLTAMNYAMDFAKENRKRIFLFISDAIHEVLPNCVIEEPIDVHHNYARMEHHYGQNVLVHRKGATSAKEGEIGLIPGSQGSKSYVVKGKGNPQSFTSCSHGAGRKMSRKEAIRRLDLKDEIKKLDDQGIIHAIRNKNDLDEASGAYKDIEDVMRNQLDLVEIIEELTPLAVIKG